jgi:chromosome partitioning protein
MLVDADPQGTARDWRETAGETYEAPPVFGIDRPTLDKDIPKVSDAFEIIVIDGAAKTTPMMVSAIKAADVVLIPVQPSAADLWAASDLVDVLQARQQVTGGTPYAAFVVSRQIAGTRVAQGVQEVLDGYGLPVLASRTSQRVAYVEALASGRSVLDLPEAGKAAAEIKDLLAELTSVFESIQAT